MLLLSSADFFQNLPFQKILSGTLSECQMVSIQIRFDILLVQGSFGPDLAPNCLQRLSADDKSCSKERV